MACFTLLCDDVDLWVRYYFGMDLHSVEEVMLECDRVISEAQARQLRAIAELGRRSGSEFDPDQVALVMRWSGHRAADRLALAQRLTDVLPASLAALESGTIDLYKAKCISNLTLPLTREQAQAVEAKALEKASEQTGASLRQRLRRLVSRVDPDGAAERAKAKKADRHAGLVVEDDDMAKLYVYLCADKAMAPRC